MPPRLRSRVKSKCEAEELRDTEKEGWLFEKAGEQVYYNTTGVLEAVLCRAKCEKEVGPDGTACGFGAGRL